MKFGAPVTMTVLARTELDEYGERVVIDSAGDFAIDDCQAAPAASSGLVDARQSGATFDLAVIAPVGADVVVGDRVTLDDSRFPGVWRIEDEPEHWRTPAGGVDRGVLVRLRRAHA